MVDKNKAQEELQAIHEFVEPWQWPAQTGSLIQQVLDDQSADPAIRLIAVGMAGDSVMINDELGRRILDLLKNNDEPDELRARAAIALGLAFEHADLFEFDDPDDLLLSEKLFNELQAALKIIYHDAGTPKLVRRRILEASIRAPQDWHSGAIQTAHAVDDHDWRITALFCSGYSQGFEQQIIESLDSDNEGISYEALVATGNRGLKKAWPKVARIFADADTDRPNLFAAIEAAMTINLPESAEPLRELTMSDDEEIVDAAMEALAMMRVAGGDGDPFEDDW